jgi:predicted enzyme related to lactoylglutathione lyase
MPNPIIHFEIGCRDLEKTRTFFGSLFDWNMQWTGNAAMIDTGFAVNGHISGLGHEPHNYTIFYVQVDEVASYIEKAVAL